MLPFKKFENYSENEIIEIINTIGAIIAVIFRLIVYGKSKNVKKYRRNEEYGSARWGKTEDIAP